METKILEVALQGALVPFEAVALPKARVVLRDEESGFDDQQLVRDFAYVVDRKSTGGARKTFFAERYGGLGIFNNGGGVRCGLTGDYQVKGIGLNPLLGRATPSSYRSGAMTGVEAVREFVWSHLVRLALPYGAARVVAVIDAGVDYEAKGKAPYRRYLAVRETRVRLAQMERASHFKPKWKHSMPHDSERTRLALEHVAGGRLNGAEPAVLKQLFERLQDVAVRQADQLASAKMRRLNHGALSSSNACMDGGWLDFGSVSHQDRYASDPHFRLGFWDEHEYFLHGLGNICHVIELYTHGAFPAQEGFARFVEAFRGSYEGTLAKEACGLLGLESSFLNGASGQLFDHLRTVGNGALNVLRSSSAPCTWALGADEPEAPTFPERCALVLCGLASPEALGTAHGFEAKFGESLIEVGACYMSAHSVAGRDPEHVQRALLLDATRRAAFVPDLAAAAMNERLTDALESGLPVGPLVAKLLMEGEAVFAPRTDSEVVLCGGPERTVFDPGDNVLRGAGSNEAFGLISDLPEVAKQIVGRQLALVQSGGPG